MDNIKRGDIFLADLGINDGSEQSGERYVVVIQNNVGNLKSPTVIITPLTSKLKKVTQPTHVFLDRNKYRLEKDSMILAEQIRTLDKIKLKRRHCRLLGEDLVKLNDALKVSIAV